MSENAKTESFAIAARSQSPTKTAVQVRDFEFVVDEPQSLGGTDTGPNPVEYLLGSWAGCLNVVAYTVAAEHNIDLDDLTIDIEGPIDLRGFLDGTDGVRPGYTQLDVTLKPTTAADTEAIDAWAREVETRCPVGDNIQHQTPTVITVERD